MGRAVSSGEIPFGLDPSTFAALVALGILLGTRLIDAMLPRGKSFRFTQRWFVNGEKVKEEVTEKPKPSKEDDDE